MKTVECTFVQIPIYQGQRHTITLPEIENTGVALVMIIASAKLDISMPKMGNPVTLSTVKTLGYGLYLNGVERGQFFCSSSSIIAQTSMMTSYQHFFPDLKSGDTIQINILSHDGNWSLERFECFTMWYNHDGPVCKDGDVARSEPVKLNEPRNNDGRETCFWCGGKLKDSEGFLNTYKVCINCGK